MFLIDEREFTQIVMKCQELFFTHSSVLTEKRSKLTKNVR